MPGGKVVVYTGILDLAKNDDQLATVMSHEGKIKVDGFVMTSNGLELKFEEQMNKPKKVVAAEPEINEHKEITELKEDPKKFVLDDW